MRLDGIRVVDLTTLLPGPYATQLLADMGADVVKVERPGVGDPARAMSAAPGAPDVFSAVNRGKRSVTLDLKTEAGREAALAIASDADGVVEGFRPGVAERLGVGYDEIRRENPGVVYCSLTGFGHAGPHRDRAGHDLNYVGMAGMLDMTRSPDGDVAIPGFPVADMAGGLFAAFSVLGALLSRELGGSDPNGSDPPTGEHVDVAMTDVVLSFSQAVAGDALGGGDPRGRETPLTGEFPCYDVYETADGEHVTLAALEPRFFRAFCAAIDRPDLADAHFSTDPAEREALRETLREEFRARPRAEWADLGEETMVAPVRSVAEAVDSDQARERGLVRGEDAPTGLRVGFPAIPSGGLVPDESVPDPGEHTVEVLEAAGYDESGIERLREDGAI
ncbi:CoA transferase [Halobacteriales archaeon QS_8_69_26]|nr:MAG: CoA transferase [Halobacteriales archaeon QS_8_69_26]